MIKKRILLFALLVFSAISYAQSYKFIYELDWKPSPDSSTHKKELFVLLTEENQPSYFAEYEKFKQDSAFTKAVNDFKRSKGGALGIQLSGKDPIFTSIIFKDIPKKEIKIEDKAFSNGFETTYHCTIPWQLSQEEVSNTIMGYPVMKATADFGGRLWTAYYTPDIPINDGPYKFYGLPGLILKIYDNTNDYNYEIKAVSKENHDISERNFGGSPIATLSPEKWEEFWEKYKTQPSMVLENLGNKQVTYVIDGESVAKKSVKDQYNKKEWKRLKNFENPIELTRGCK